MVWCGVCSRFRQSNYRIVCVGQGNQQIALTMCQQLRASTSIFLCAILRLCFRRGSTSTVKTSALALTMSKSCPNSACDVQHPGSSSPVACGCALQVASRRRARIKPAICRLENSSASRTRSLQLLCGHRYKHLHLVLLAQLLPLPSVLSAPRTMSVADVTVCPPISALVVDASAKVATNVVHAEDTMADVYVSSSLRPSGRDSTVSETGTSLRSLCPPRRRPSRLSTRAVSSSALRRGESRCAYRVRLQSTDRLSLSFRSHAGVSVAV